VANPGRMTQDSRSASFGIMGRWHLILVGLCFLLALVALVLSATYTVDESDSLKQTMLVFILLMLAVLQGDAAVFALGARAPIAGQAR